MGVVFGQRKSLGFYLDAPITTPFFINLMHPNSYVKKI